MSTCSIVDLGLIPYARAWELQKRLVAARKAGAIEDVLLFCEHPHVITLGRSGNRANLLASENVLQQKGVEYFATSRGGDITYHGPGQIVGYPILNLGAIRRDVVWYVRTLEEAIIRTSAELRIAARREPGKTGIWVGPTSRPVIPSGSEESAFLSAAPDAAPEKLAAIGVHISRWVTSHGFAYNVSTDLRYFDLIVPCGIADRKATSLEKLLSRSVTPDWVKPRLTLRPSDLFSLAPRPASREQPFAALAHFEDTVPS